MKRFMLSSLGYSLCASSLALMAGESNQGVLTEVPARFMFVPGGFDNNDQVQVTLDGYLPNSCYKITSPRVTFDDATKTFTVTTIANNFGSDTVACGTYEVPYTVTANLGQVKEGQYQIVTKGGLTKSLTIKHSSGVGPDEELYAPVDHVHIDVSLSRKEITAALEGRFTNSCMRWQEIKTIDEGDTLVLLPIIAIENSADCQDREMQYKAMTVKLPWRQPGRYLLHVRGLSGAAINNVFTVDAVP